MCQIMKNAIKHHHPAQAAISASVASTAKGSGLGPAQKNAETTWCWKTMNHGKSC